MRLISIFFIVLLAGFLGNVFLGNLLHLYDAGAVTAIAVMGTFIIHELRSGGEDRRE